MHPIISFYNELYTSFITSILQIDPNITITHINIVILGIILILSVLLINVLSSIKADSRIKKLGLLTLAQAHSLADVAVIDAYEEINTTQKKKIGQAYEKGRNDTIKEYTDHATYAAEARQKTPTELLVYRAAETLIDGDLSDQYNSVKSQATAIVESMGIDK